MKTFGARLTIERVTLSLHRTVKYTSYTFSAFPDISEAEVQFEIRVLIRLSSLDALSLGLPSG